MQQTIAYIGLGSNLGDRRMILETAARMMGEFAGISLLQLSELIETAPEGGPDNQGDYLNGVAKIVTTLEPESLLEALGRIELALGRDRDSEERFGPRTCDLDILLYGDMVLDSPSLTIPHPRMHCREFVLSPMASIAPDVLHPVVGKKISGMLEELSCSSRKLISVIGPMAAGKTFVAERLSSDLGAEIVYEDYASNPFIAAASSMGDKWALPSQIYFILSRVEQLAPYLMSSGVVVSDYGFCQDRLYAEILLEGNDLKAYHQLFSRFESLICPPSIIVHVDAPLDILVDRIKDRGRDFEADIDHDFLRKLRDSHFDLSVPPDCVMLNYDTSGDQDQNEHRYAELLEEIRTLI